MIVHWIEEKTRLLLSFPGPATLNFIDEHNVNVDILRLELGQAKVFVPAKYLKQTAAYDNNKNRTQVGAILPGNGWSASQSTGGFTLSKFSYESVIFLRSHTLFISFPILKIVYFLTVSNFTRTHITHNQLCSIFTTKANQRQWFVCL